MTISPPRLDEGALTALKSRLRGPLLQSAEPGYDESRTIWNAMIDRRPALVIRCLNTADVMAGVNFAREQGLALAVKGGGHNIAGLAVADGALLLDMSLMRGVWVDKERRIAHAQAGCLLGDVDRETQLHGLAAPLGFVSNTGIAGLTVGGGFGYLTRRFGWTCDNVTAMDVVLADGSLARATADENSDLFWALRGGGGNFGVVINFEYRLFDLGPEITGGAIAWPRERTPEVLELFRHVTTEAPVELTCVLGLRKAPPAPWIKPEFHGKDIAALFICYTRPSPAGDDLVKQIKALGEPAGDIVQKRTYISQQNLLDGTQPNGRRYYWKSEFLDGHDPEMLDIAARHAAAIPSPHSAVLVFPLAGAEQQFAPDHSSAANRDAYSVLNIAGSWEDAADDARNIDWVRETWRDLRRFSSGGTYVNFLTEDESEERVKQAYGPHLVRLAEAKAKWDPDNLFHLNKNIAPGTGH